MVLDIHEALSTSQALTATAVGENVKDLLTDRSIGNGEPMCVMFNVEVSADQTTGDEDYTFDIEVSSDAAQTTAVKLLNRIKFESGIPDAPYMDADLLVAGYTFVLVIPPLTLSVSERYLGVRYTLAGTTPTITVSAYLMPLKMVTVGQVSYPKGYTFTHA